MKIDVHLRKMETGETVVFHDDSEWNDQPEWTAIQAVCSMYGDGNYNCDCNREIFFCRALGVSPPENPECGESRFHVDKIVDRASGDIIYQDDE